MTTTSFRGCLLGSALAAFTTVATFAQDSAPIRDPERIIRRSVLSWKELKTQNVVMQGHDYSCGAAALATVQRYYWGDNVTERQVLNVVEKILTPEEITDRVLHGLSLADLQKTAQEMKYEATIGRISLSGLSGSKVPVIVALHLDSYDHFVVVRGFSDGDVYLADPVRGKIRIDVNKFTEQWIDNALLVVAKPGETASQYDQLAVLEKEVDFPWLNQQFIRTRPERTILSPR